ncbi:NERD domain protein [Phycicoccus sp. Root101]|nr:nuclease-related domain-containing protein [Phycicoccus sp. Root101]KQU68365.1 NERD domain protein [Phycicoccus sp. Root101]
MRLRYAGTCRVCGAGIPQKTQAVYERGTKTVRCLSHDMTVPPESTSATDAGPVTLQGVMEAGPVANAVVEAGTAGASARREFERRKAKREQRIRTQHPRIGGFLLAISEERQSTTAWDTGALGEEKLGKGLDRLASDRTRLLHDRRIPRSKANIDHIAVTPNGVYVIDAKKYRGRPHLKIEGGILRPRVERLLVGSRDCTKLVDGVLKQVDVVRAALAEEVPARGVLCFVEADWPLIGGSFTTRDVQALWPKKLYPQLEAEGALSVEAIDRLHRRLAKALPAA